MKIKEGEKCPECNKIRTYDLADAVFFSEIFCDCFIGEIDD